MNENHDDRLSVYEIGYLLVGSLPAEKIAGETDALRKLVTDAGSTVIAEETPHEQTLAYEIRKKNVSGTYEKFTTAYFGWVKFEVGSDKIEALKKAFEIHPSVLRMILLSTVHENTYLGKRASLVAASFNKKPADGAVIEEKKEVPVVAAAAPASIEEMDKSIDAMVKEA